MNNKENYDSRLKEIEKLIGYQFKNKHLGLTAITTRAYSSVHAECPDNQALEFLGDAVLSLVTAEMLYEKWSQLQDNKIFHDMTPEGVMTKIRQKVVNNQYLAECASRHNLCEFIYDSPENLNAVNNGLTDGPGADIIEALIAAIYLDNNKSLTRAKGFILDFLNLSGHLNDEEQLIKAVTRKNPKDRLIHKFQKLKKHTPSIEYPVKEHRVNTDDNTHLWVLKIRIDGKLLPGITGEGPNKDIAEYDAAKKAYQYLNKIKWDLDCIDHHPGSG